ncbi:MAG: TolB-like 6-bladed beta-propeller domain-containing protein [Tenacibaculum sp.]|nr:TolB-like 6-bladed beta-propeller domain-containing protein [Tenacibaculum sp.]
MKKNNFKIIPLYLFAFLAIASCVSKEAKNNEVISEISLNGRNVFEDKFNLQNLYLIDSLVLTKNLANKEGSLFSVYNNNDEYEHLFDFGSIGDGPNEFEAGVYCTTQFERDNDGIKFWVFEMNRNKLSQIDLTSTLEKKSLVISKSIRLRPGLSFKEVFHVTQNVIIGNPDNLSLKMNQLVIYDGLNNRVSKNIPFPFDFENQKSNDINHTQQNYNALFINNLRYNQRRNKLVSGMISIDKIDIFNTDGSLYKSLMNEGDKAFDFDANMKEPKGFNVDVQLGDKYIYVLYSGDSMSNYFENSTPTKIKIFDWGLNLKHVLKTDASLNFISVDENHKKIIGISMTQEKIVEYKLENLNL